MKPKIVLLSTDTAHHRFFVNKMKDDGLPIDLVIFETKKFIPKFQIGPFFEKEEAEFEETKFKEIIDIGKINIESLSFNDINDEQILEVLRTRKINYGIVFGTGLIKEELIRYFNGNLINIHRGIAEEYRGLDSDLWSIYHDDFKSIGVTIHKIEPQLDTGDISYLQSIKLQNDMKIFQLRFYTTILAYELVKQTFLDFINNKNKFSKQKKIGRYYSAMPIQLKDGLAEKFENYVQKL
jgi:methionyl-tRNA formyltransferase